MLKVEFHSGVVDKFSHTIRLLHKALAKNSRVAVTGDAATLTRLDADLWTLEPGSFVPHVCLVGGRTAHPRSRRTPIWLVEAPESAVQCEVLVNLGDGVHPSLSAFARVIDIVSTDPADRAAGANRWRRYKALTVDLSNHAIGASSKNTARPDESRGAS